MKKSVSIITPSYNQGRFIERTIKSVLSQGHTDLEYFIFDGGSTDNTLTILTSYEQFLYWNSEKDNGQSHAVNKGLKLSTGPIIGWLNSDDIYYPEAINSVVEFFCENPNIDVVYGMADYIDVNDEITGPYPTESPDFNRLISHCYLCQPATFFRRSVIKRAGLLDESLQYCMDYEYWIRLAKHKLRFTYLPIKLAGARMYPQTKTLGFRMEAHQEIKSMLKKHLDYVPDRWIMNYAHVFLEEKFLKKKYSRRNIEKSRFLGLTSEIFIFIVACFESKKWNNKISEDLVKHMSEWIKGRLDFIFSKLKCSVLGKIKSSLDASKKRVKY
jgi:glycosyltransferase involved in cell wall biosynthesis